MENPSKIPHVSLVNIKITTHTHQLNPDGQVNPKLLRHNSKSKLLKVSKDTLAETIQVSEKLVQKILDNLNEL